MVRVALYARVSLDEAAESARYQEVDNQLVPLRDLAKAIGAEVYEEYVDRSSGANPNRPAFRKMLQDGMLRRFEGVLVWKLDRFSREGISNTLAYIKQLKSRGVWVKSLTESWVDTKDSTGELLISIFSWVAEEERRKISERTKAGIQRQKNLGHYKGGRPKKGTPVSV